MNKEFCQNLKKARIKLGLTQVQLADRLNISPSTIGMYEQGRREPDIKLLQKICESLNISADELLNVKINNIIKTAELDKIIKQMINFIKNQDVVTFNNAVLSKDKKSLIIFFLGQLLK